MKWLLTLFSLFFIFTTLHAGDNVYLKNGYVYNNVFIIDTSFSMLRVRMNGEEKKIDLMSVSWIDSVAYDSTKSFSIVRYNVSELKKLHPENIENSSPVYKNTSSNHGITAFYGLAAVSAGFAWDFFSEASDIQEQINLLSKIPGESTSSLTNKKYRKIILGIAMGEITVVSSSNSVTVAYNF